MAPAIVWFRRDLRLDDNVPLDAALLAGDTAAAQEVVVEP